MNVLNGHLTLLFLRATGFHPSVLLPNLRALKWRPYIITRSQPNSFQTVLSVLFLWRLLVPSLVSLDVSLTDSDDESLHSFLANYPLLCPNLKSIVISVGAPERVSRTTIDVLSRAITRHEHLDRFDISAPINDVGLTHIALSLQVKKLSLVLHPVKSNLHRICIPSDGIPFRTAEDLALEVWDLSCVMTLLRPQDQTFRSFTLCHHSPLTPEAVSALFTALVSRHRAHSLRSLTLWPDCFAQEGHRDAPVDLDEPFVRQHLSYDAFRPLSSLCYLTKLVLDLGYCFSIDDDDLVSLTRNWPCLQALLLYCQQYVYDHPWRWAKYVTFRGLLSVLASCPDLREITLPLDARAVPVDTGDVVCNPSLTYLYFPESPIIDADSVADLILRHFPSVTEVTTSFNVLPEAQDDDIEVYQGLWCLVDSYFRDMYVSEDDSDEDA